VPYVVNWFGVTDDSTQVLIVERDPDATDFAQNGIYLSADYELVCTQDAVEASDNYVRGWAISVEGALRIFQVDGGEPAGAKRNGGFLTSSTGQLCVTSDAVDHYIAGVPVNVYGAVCVVGSTPPIGPMITRIIIYATGGGPETSGVAVSDISYGSSGSVSAFYTVEATFLSDHPGLANIDFSGVAPPGGGPVPVPPYAGITTIGPATDASPPRGVYDSAVGSEPLCYYYNFAYGVEILFSTPVNSAGLRIESQPGAYHIYFYDGATELINISRTGAGYPPGLNSFSGYSTATGGPTTTFYQQETGTDYYIQEVADAYIQE
jgi:hypothetical protein